MDFPSSGRSLKSIKRELKNYEVTSGLDPDSLKKQLCASYNLLGRPDLRTLIQSVFEEFMESNTLIHHEKGVYEMERQVMSMIGNLLNVKNSSGIFTSGGTESNMLALCAAKNKMNKRGSVILPSNAHPSFFKGCEIFGLEAIKIAVGKDFKAEPRAMERAIRNDTVGIIATAGSWPMGVIDPLREIGEIAEKHSLYYHIDAAWGGLICPWLREAGYEIPEIGFNIPGVSSISVDPHKQGFSIQPGGTITFGDAKLKELASWTITEAGFSYTTAGILGSRPGFSVAITWALFNYLGRDGYIELSKKCYDLTMKLINDAEKISGISFPVLPSINLTTMVSKTKNMDVVKRKLRRKGWLFFESSGKPYTEENGIIFAVFPHHEKIFPTFLRDLRSAIS